jgi:hypothetical protein
MLPGLGNMPLIKRLGLSSLSAAVQALINGALQRSGGTMTGALVLEGNAANVLEAVPLQQAEAIADAVGTAAADALASAAAVRMQYSLTAVRPATGVAVDFNSIPAWAQRIMLVPREVSTNGTSRVQILLGTSAGYLGSGYRGAFVYAANGGGSIGGNVANNFAMDAFAAATDLRNGAVQFSKAPGTNTWIQSGTVGLSNAAAVSTVGGSVPLPGPLTGLRVYTNSADVFDNGDFFLLIEG